MADDFKDISHLYKVTPSAKTIIDGEDLVETKQKSKAYAWCDVLQSVTGFDPRSLPFLPYGLHKLHSSWQRHFLVSGFFDRRLLH